MFEKKHAPIIIVIGVALAVILCFAAIIFSSELTEAFGGVGVRMEYESRLFDTDGVIEINIKMDESEWNKMLANATSEEYYVCDVTVNGTTIRNVAIRPKGNTSLSAIAMDPDSNRFSMKLEFDHYVKGQTCFGLDKLILNNNYADATNMKEAVIYDMYRYLGADASLYNYAKVSVNGEYWGVYLALEAVEQSFMLRNYGTQDGELYKPDTLEMGSGSSGKGGGADLNYTDDELDSYQSIWSSEITGTKRADHIRVVTALRNISQGTDLETYLDVDNVLRYMAVHVFAVNDDSLSGNMTHNYYIYEYDGQLNILPWDYNLAFGGMSMGRADGTEMVNDAIDTPFSATEFFDALLENEEYLAKYHEYLKQLVDEYVNGGRFDEVYNRIRSQIDELVETDPTAFFTYEEYEKATGIFYEAIKLRAESIDGQISGSIPSTDEGQRRNQSALINASHIDLTAMGQFDMGGGGGGGFNPGGNMPDMGDFTPDGSTEQDGGNSGGMPDQGSLTPGESMPDQGGENPGGSGSDPNGSTSDPGSSGGGAVAQQPSGQGESVAPGDSSSSGGGPDAEQPSGEAGTTEAGSEESKSNRPDSGSRPGGNEGGFPGGFTPGGNGGGFNPGGSGDTPGQSGNSTVTKNLILYGICFVIALGAVLALIFIKRRR